MIVKNKFLRSLIYQYNRGNNKKKQDYIDYNRERLEDKKHKDIIDNIKNDDILKEIEKLNKNIKRSKKKTT
jgi:hypothetical protein